MRDEHNNSTKQVLLDKNYISLLTNFKHYNAKGHKLFCSYMSAGQEYKNELLVIGREPLFWPQGFYISELNTKGEEFIFNSKVKDPAAFQIDYPCPFYPASYLTGHDSFWDCVKDLVLKLGICENESLWSSNIALTYLYKLAYGNRFLLEKPRIMQLDFCRNMLNLEIEILKPKRILFLTGIRQAKDFLNLPDTLEVKKPVQNLGSINFGTHTAKTLITFNPKKFHRNELVDLILKELK